jgi:hypothetical protein
MSVSHSKAELIAQQAIQSGGNNVTDPVSVITIILTIIDNIMTMLKSCKRSPEDSRIVIQNASNGALLSWFHRRQLWRLVRSHNLPNGVTHVDVYNALLRHGTNLSVSEVAAMYRGD